MRDLRLASTRGNELLFMKNELLFMKKEGIQGDLPLLLQEGQGTHRHFY